ncbi:aminomethyl-transferring glycine dehydrogenase subunit GcvPA [candidate division KSB1 bacterium]|nr:aminomethyl-transferring glycine dehydrogenase subunit GcvPA [candidate division KSB1 bacterium]
MPFIPNTDDERKEMLAAIGVQNVEELISNIPKDLRFKGKMELPEPVSEMEIASSFHKLVRENTGCNDYTSFLGGGAYDHYIPAAIDHVISRSEFYTAYTPYQPEVSQGTLQATYEYQSMIAELTAMDIANASMYDGSSALAEAALMALTSPKRNKIIVSKTINPLYRRVIETYTSGQDVRLELVDHDGGTTNMDELNRKIDEQTAAVLIQHPNFFGYLEEMQEIAEMAHEKGALFITSNDPISLALLDPPGAYDADIATGEGQALGNSLNYGGPYLGIFTAKEKFLRKMPGRIVGETVDTKNRRGFVLTFQAREQHIRREKATSNICTNQALNALAATVYLALMGRNGLERVATVCLNNSHYLADEISKLDGFELKFQKPFFKEFVVRTPMDPDKIIQRMISQNIQPGISFTKFDYDLKDCLLIATTEKRTREEMDQFIAALRSL